MENQSSESKPSVAAQTVFSYLEDVEKQRDAIARMNAHECERKAHDIISGDLRLARKEIENTHDFERPVLRSLCNQEEGMINLNMIEPFREYIILEEYQDKIKQCIERAVICFQAAVDDDPDPSSYFKLGTAQNAAGQKWDAVQSLTKVVESEHPELAIQARKMISRIGPITKEQQEKEFAPYSSPPISSPTGGGGVGVGVKTNATTLLVLGVLGIICCGLLAPVTWVMSNNTMATIDAGAGAESDRSMVNIARILGIIGTVLLVIGVLWFFARQ